MKKAVVLFHILLWAGVASAQERFPEGWAISNTGTLQLSQTALSNWAAGGESAIVLNSNLQMDARNKRGQWVTEFGADWLVGFYKAKGDPLRKNQDHLSITFISGYHMKPNYGVGVLAEVTTQVAASHVFDPAFVQAFGGDPEKGIKTGNFLSPGYIETGAGFRYVNLKPLVNFIFMPIVAKQTVILDEDVRALDAALPHGLYGNMGETVRSELGASLKLMLSVPLMTNVTAKGDMKFFSNYKDRDLDTTVILELVGKINKHLSASVHTTLLYDNDVDTNPAEPGNQQEVQIREVLGINLTYSLSR